MSRSRPDAGLWYYHAPTANTTGLPKTAYPPASQIPGLNGVPLNAQEADEMNERSKMWFKDTDTPYIRLAKMGGRKDLLTTHNQIQQGEDAAPIKAASSNYTHRNPRNDWFYQLDNMAEDAAIKSNEPKLEHRFQVPDYMAHHERKAKPPVSYAANSPFATYQNVNDSIDFNPTDKTKKIKEPLKPGFGRRLAKQSVRDKTSYLPMEYPVREVARSAPQPPPKYEYTKSPQQLNEQNNMSKILSYGYQKDWLDEQGKWWQDNESRAVRFAEQYGMDPNTAPHRIMAGNPQEGPGITGSEYNQQYAHHSSPQNRIPEGYNIASQMNQGRVHYGN